MKLTTLNTVKGTTKNAPQGGKQKTIKRKYYEIKTLTRKLQNQNHHAREEQYKK